MLSLINKYTYIWTISISDLSTQHQRSTGCVNSKCYLACWSSFFHFDLICNMTTFRKGKNSWPFDPTQGSRVCVRSAYLLSWCFVLNSLSFDMQHNDYFQKKIWIDLSTQPPGSRCVCRQTICYHVATCLVSFNLTCNMTTSRKIFASAPIP